MLPSVIDLLDEGVVFLPERHVYGSSLLLEAVGLMLMLAGRPLTDLWSVNPPADPASNPRGCWVSKYLVCAYPESPLFSANYLELYQKPAN